MQLTACAGRAQNEAVATAKAEKNAQDKFGKENKSLELRRETIFEFSIGYLVGLLLLDWANLSLASLRTAGSMRLRRSTRRASVSQLLLV